MWVPDAFVGLHCAFSKSSCEENTCLIVMSSDAYPQIICSFFLVFLMFLAPLLRILGFMIYASATGFIEFVRFSEKRTWTRVNARSSVEVEVLLRIHLKLQASRPSNTPRGEIANLPLF